jgi:hypothetical protein
MYSQFWLRATFRQPVFQSLVTSGEFRDRAFSVIANGKQMLRPSGGSHE